MKFKTTNNENQVWVFDSQSEVDNFNDPTCYTRFDHNPDFVGEELESWDKVQARMQSDWKYGMDVLESFLERIRQIELPELKSCKRKVVWNWDDGDEFDPERAMEGQPPWKKFVRKETKGPTTVTIIVDTTASATVDAGDILWRGAAAIALTQLIEEKGYSVELWVISGANVYQEDETKVMISACQKRCEDPLDTSTLINNVAGWFFRTVTFNTWWTVCAKQNRVPKYNLGNPYLPTQSDLDMLSEDANRVFIAGVFSFSATMDVIEAELEKLVNRTPSDDGK